MVSFSKDVVGVKFSTVVCCAIVFIGIMFLAVMIAAPLGQAMKDDAEEELEFPLESPKLACSVGELGPTNLVLELKDEKGRRHVVDGRHQKIVNEYLLRLDAEYKDGPFRLKIVGAHAYHVNGRPVSLLIEMVPKSVSVP